MINLENVQHSMTYVLKENYSAIINLKSKNEMYVAVKNLFDSANINTKASNRLLSNLNNARSLLDAQYIITNSMMSGSGNSVYVGTSKDWRRK